METKGLIQVKQVPIIAYDNLKIFSDTIKERISKLEIDKLVVTEETKKTAKKLRAELVAESKEVEEQRIILKKAILAPYEEFEGAYKKLIISQYKEAVDELDKKTLAIDKLIIERKTEAITKYFNELIVSEGVEWLTIDKAGLKITYADACTESKLKKEVNAFVRDVKIGINSITNLTQPEDFKNEVMLIFKESLDFPKAFLEVTERHNKLAEMKAKAEMEKAEQPAQPTQKAEPKTEEVPLTAPKVVEVQTQPQPTPQEQGLSEKDLAIKEATFSVQAPLWKLKKLADFIRENEITILK